MFKPDHISVLILLQFASLRISCKYNVAWGGLNLSLSVSAVLPPGTCLRIATIFHVSSGPVNLDLKKKIISLNVCR